MLELFERLYVCDEGQFGLVTWDQVAAYTDKVAHHYYWIGFGVGVVVMMGAFAIAAIVSNEWTKRKKLKQAANE